MIYLLPAFWELHNTLSTPPLQETSLSFVELRNMMSPDAQIICNMVLATPIEFLRLGPQLARGEVARILREEGGWTWSRIWNGIREVRAALNGSK